MKKGDIVFSNVSPFFKVRVLEVCGSSFLGEVLFGSRPCWVGKTFYFEKWHFIDDVSCSIEDCM